MPLNFLDDITPAHTEAIERCPLCHGLMNWVFEAVQKCLGCGYLRRVFTAYDAPGTACSCCKPMENAT